MILRIALMPDRRQQGAGIMLLLDTLLKRLIVRGELSVVDHASHEYRYGAADPLLDPVRIRFTDRRTPLAIARDPPTATGEAYMDGRLLVEQGDIRDLLRLVAANTTFERGDWLGPATLMGKVAERVLARLDQINWKRRSRRNAEHTYGLKTELFELFLDQDLQYTCAFWRDLGNTLETAQYDKKVHIAAKLALKPGLRILDIGCGWGGLALYLHQVSGAEVLGVALAE